MLRTDQADNFPGRQRHIHFRMDPVIGHGRIRTFRFLGNAGHDGYAEDLVRTYLKKIRVIALDDRAEHLLRRLGSADLRYEFGIMSFYKTYPSRAAGSKHGEFIFVRFLQFFQKLAGLFHDGQIR